LDLCALSIIAGLGNSDAFLSKSKQAGCTILLLTRDVWRLWVGDVAVRHPNILHPMSLRDMGTCHWEGTDPGHPPGRGCLRGVLARG